jgi:hypothetical protein
MLRVVLQLQLIGGQKLLIDNSSTQSLDWSNRYLYDNNSNVSIDYQNRVLSGNWTIGGSSGISTGISVLTSLPSNFNTLLFKNGILTGII